MNPIVSRPTCPGAWMHVPTARRSMPEETWPAIPYKSWLRELDNLSKVSFNNHTYGMFHVSMLIVDFSVRVTLQSCGEGFSNTCWCFLFLLCGPIQLAWFDARWTAAVPWHLFLKSRLPASLLHSRRWFKKTPGRVSQGQMYLLTDPVFSAFIINNSSNA